MTRFALYGSLNYASIFTDSMVRVIPAYTAVQLQGIVFLFREASHPAALLENVPQDLSFHAFAEQWGAVLHGLCTKTLGKWGVGVWGGSATYCASVEFVYSTMCSLILLWLRLFRLCGRYCSFPITASPAL